MSDGSMKRLSFIAILSALCVPAFAKKKKRRLAISVLDESGEEDFSYGDYLYSVNSSYPYETAQLIGPDFAEGMTLNRVIVQGQLESFESFQTRLIRIVDALRDTY